MALPARLKLKGENEIKKVFSGGKTFKYAIFSVKMLKNNLDHARIILNVGKNVLPKAIQRNRVKRIAAQAIKNSGFLDTGNDAVFIFSSAILRKPLKEIKGELEDSMKKFFVQNDKFNFKNN